MKAYGFDVPEGYNWVAVDEDGEVYAFIEKPELQCMRDGSGIWNNTFNTQCKAIGELGYFPTYKDSLIEINVEQGNKIKVGDGVHTEVLGASNMVSVPGKVAYIEGDECVVSLEEPDALGNKIVCRHLDKVKTSSPEEEKKEKLLHVWRSQSLEHAYDHLNSKSDIRLTDLFDWMENNKDAITKIFNE